MAVYSALISTVFEAVDSEGISHNRAVAFTSALPEADVSYVAQSFARELAIQTQRRVVIVDASAFHDLQVTDSKQVLRQCKQTGFDNLLTLPALEPSEIVSAEAPQRIFGWHSTPQIRQTYLNTLRRNFDYIIIDCPALSASSDVRALAPIIDGVAVVVGSMRKRVRKAQTTQDVVEALGAKFLGYILS